MSYIRIITFGEFEEIADKYNLIFPEKYWEISDSTLGIIKDKTFYEIEISNKAKEILFRNLRRGCRY